MKKTVAILILCLLMVSMTASIALAVDKISILDTLEQNDDKQGEEVLNKTDSFISFIIYKLLPLAGVGMMGWAFFKLTTGSDEGKKGVLYAAMGVGGMALAPTIVSWLMNTFG